MGDVISALAQKNSHVPYRNSKLTQVLQSSLGGQAKTVMFVQLNPDIESYSETVSTLKFSERVSGVELGAARSNREGRGVRELMEQGASLKDQLASKNDDSINSIVEYTLFSETTKEPDEPTEKPNNVPTRQNKESKLPRPQHKPSVAISVSSAFKSSSKTASSRKATPGTSLLQKASSSSNLRSSSKQWT